MTPDQLRELADRIGELSAWCMCDAMSDQRIASALAAAADYLRAQADARQTRTIVTPLPGLAPTHRCLRCNALWRQCDDHSWNLRSAHCGPCCDNGDMAAAHIQPLYAAPAPQPADAQPVAPSEEAIEGVEGYLTDFREQIDAVTDLTQWATAIAGYVLLVHGRHAAPAPQPTEAQREPTKLEILATASNHLWDAGHHDVSHAIDRVLAASGKEIAQREPLSDEQIAAAEIGRKL